MNASQLIDRNTSAHTVNGSTAWHLVSAAHEATIRDLKAQLDRATGLVAFSRFSTVWLPYFKGEMLCGFEDGQVIECYVNGQWVNAENAIPAWQIQEWDEALSEKDSDTPRADSPGRIALQRYGFPEMGQ